MRASIRLGRVAGIPIGLDLSVFVILAILIFGLAVGQFPSAFPGRSVAAYLVAAIVAAILFFVSLLVHELAHAIVARRNGIEVAGITLWLFGGVSQLRSEPRTPGADFRIAVVGPLSSLAVGVGCAVMAVVLRLIGVTGLPVGVFMYLSGVNVLLALFNLIPAAPLDGGRVLRAALWQWRGDRVQAAVVAAGAGRLFGFACVALGVFQVATGRGLGGVWLVLIGLFLVNAATAEEQYSRRMGDLHGVRVRDAMTPDPLTADPSRSLDGFIADTVLTHRFSAYPLVSPDGRLIGLTTLNRIRDVPPEDRAGTRLGDIAQPAGKVPTARADDPITELLTRMAESPDARAVVIDDAQRVVGIVTPTDATRAILLRDLMPLDPYQGRGGADISTWHSPRSGQRSYV